MHDKSQLITSACKLLEVGDKERVVYLLQSKAPLAPVINQPKRLAKRVSNRNKRNSTTSKEVTKREYTEVESTSLFITDGFIDRYSGERLVFPGVLRLLSDIFPKDFPHHPNWKSGACHQWYWELYPTVDHVVPVTLEGVDNAANWVTTSMFNNLAKSNTPLDDLGWNIVLRGDFNKWDGLINWFIKYISNNSVFLKKSYIKIWHEAAIKALKQS